MKKMSLEDMKVGQRVTLADGRGATVDSLTGTLVGLSVDGGRYLVLRWDGAVVARS